MTLAQIQMLAEIDLRANGGTPPEKQQGSVADALELANMQWR